MYQQIKIQYEYVPKGILKNVFSKIRQHLSFFSRINLKINGDLQVMLQNKFNFFSLFDIFCINKLKFSCI